MDKPIYLGSLGIMELFKQKGSKTIYRTIDYPPKESIPTYGTRWCLNMETLKAGWMFCREKVFHVEQEN